MHVRILVMAKNPIVLAKTLKALLDKNKMTVKGLSKELSIPNSTLSSYLGKKATYQLDHIIKIADYFDVSMDFLLRGKESREISLKNLKLEDLFDGFVKIKIQRVLQESSIEIDN